MDGFEMKEIHRVMLVRSRTYLLHNLRPTEMFWSTLQARDILSEDMIDDIKSYKTRNEQIGKFLDLLPARGPTAFDQFCETLLECDHSHVAEYLKMMEATDNFRTEISRQCTVSDGMVEHFVSIYKNNTPLIKRFAEQKFEIMLEEQGRDLEEKEAEAHELAGKLNTSELEKSQLQAFINTCHGLSEDLSREVQTEVISKSFLRETQKYIESLKEQGSKGFGCFDMIQQFYCNIQALLSFLEQHSNNLRNNSDESSFQNPKQRSGRPYSALRRIGSAFDDTGTGTMKNKMHIVLRNLTSVIETIGTRTYVTAALIRPDLEHVVVKFKEIIDDVFYVKDVFKTTLKQKRKLESELMSLVHNWQETRRLEREVKEKQGHISELNKESQVLRKKTRGTHHRKQLEQIQHNVEQKRSQLRELQKTLERHLGSADVRIHSLLGLLPDLDDNDHLGRSDTEMFSEATGSRIPSRVTTALHGHRAGDGVMLDNTNSSSEFNSTNVVQETNKEKVSVRDSVDKSVTISNPQQDKVKETPRSEPFGKPPQPIQNGKINAASKLLERRFLQQQAANRLTYAKPRTQTNKGATLKYTPKQVSARDPKNNGPPEKLTTRIQNILNKSKDTQPTEEPPKVKVDPIDQWLARQNDQTRSDQLQKKALNFQVVEGEDRTEEIKKLGRTLVTTCTLQAPPLKPDPANEAQDSEMLENGQTTKEAEKVASDSSKGAHPTPRSQSRSHSVSGPTVSPMPVTTSQTYVKSPQPNIKVVPISPKQSSHTPSSDNGSRESSKGNDDSRKNYQASPLDGAESRPAVSLSVMAGDLLSCVPQRATPYARQSTALMEASADTYRRNQGQRQMISTNKVNLSLGMFPRS